MESTLLTLLWLSFTVFVNAEYQEGLITLAQQLRTLDDEILELKMDLPRVEEKLFNNMELSELTLRADLKNRILPALIESKVRDVLVDLIRDKSLQDIIGSHVISEIRDLKVRHNQLKSQHQSMSREMSRVRREITVYKARSVCDPKSLNDTKIKDVKDYFKLRLNNALQQMQQYTLNSREEHWSYVQNVEKKVDKQATEMKSLKRHKTKTLRRLGRVELRQDAFNKDLAILQRGYNHEFIERYTYSGTATPSPNNSRSRLLLVNFRSGGTSMQLALSGNTISTYRYLKQTSVEAITYDPTNYKIIFSRSNPAGIYSSNLDGNHVMTLRANINSYGMAVDEGRKLLVLTTYRPKYTVSRMNTDGRKFMSILDLSQHGGDPSGIALDTDKRVIYMTNHVKLFSVTYEGPNLKVIYSGYIRGVAVDLGRGFLYFNDLKRIMRRPLLGGSSVMIGETERNPINLRYYDNNVYVSSNDDGNIYSVVKYYNNDVLAKLGTVGSGSVICLIP